MQTRALLEDHIQNHRLFLFLIGILVYPRSSLRAIRRGWRCRNLYPMAPESILDSDVDSLRRQMRI